MGATQCPICFAFLETRLVTPCYVCGGWPEFVANFDSVKPSTNYRLPMGDSIVLCESCKLEEFMVPEGLGYQMFPTESRPWNVLTPTPLDIERKIAHDKFCPDCNIRLALSKLIVAYKNRDEQRDARKSPVDLEFES